jgi:hypothetical protein
MNREEGLALLRDVRSRLDTLRNDSGPRSEFENWRGQVLNLLIELFGKDSDDVLQFSNLRFEIRPEYIDQWMRQFPKVATEESGVLTFNDPPLDASGYFQRRLYDADEILLGCILKLQGTGKGGPS